MKFEELQELVPDAQRKVIEHQQFHDETDEQHKVYAGLQERLRLVKSSIADILDEFQQTRLTVYIARVEAETDEESRVTNPGGKVAVLISTVSKGKALKRDINSQSAEVVGYELTYEFIPVTESDEPDSKVGEEWDKVKIIEVESTVSEDKEDEDNFKAGDDRPGVARFRAYIDSEDEKARFDNYKKYLAERAQGIGKLEESVTLILSSMENGELNPWVEIDRNERRDAELESRRLEDLARSGNVPFRNRRFRTRH